ncbi:MAG: VOC family protein [Rhodovarius sp.]|nr:VOC family protein [Rhodovarius sp.]
MIFAYATLGTADLPRAMRFYDAALAPLGIRCDHLWAEGGWARYRHPAGGAALFLCRPFDGRPPSVGNGSMLAFTCADAAVVQKAYAAGLAAGGRDEGAPGPRPHYGPDFYGAYLRDPDGHKLCFVVGLPFDP